MGERGDGGTRGWEQGDGEEGMGEGWGMRG